MQAKYKIGYPEHHPEFRKAFLLLYLTDQALVKAFLQRDRIKPNLVDVTTDKLPILFGDIHFFLISVANLQKTLKELKNLLSSDTKLKEIIERYNEKLLHLKTFRDHLEHILDGRLDGRKRKNGEKMRDPSMLGNLANNEYMFGGDSFDLEETFNMLEKLKSDLIKWNFRTKLYPIWRL